MSRAYHFSDAHDRATLDLLMTLWLAHACVRGGVVNPHCIETFDWESVCVRVVSYRIVEKALRS